MNSIDPQYQEILRDFHKNSIETDQGLSIYAKQIFHKMPNGFPLLTTRKIKWHPIVVELLWCLRGESKIKFLHDYDCHVWDDLCYQNYKSGILKSIEENSDSTKDKGEFKKFLVLSKKDFFSELREDKEFAEQWGDLGSTVGKFWRNFSTGVLEKKYDFGGVDQIDRVIQKLTKEDSNLNLVVSSFNPEYLSGHTGDFHSDYSFQITTRELSLAERIQWVMKNTDVELENVAITEKAFDKSTPGKAISLTWNQSRLNAFTELPIMIAKYGLLLETLAKLTNMAAENLVGNFGELFLTPKEFFESTEQASRTPFPLPTIMITERNWYLHENVKQYVGKKDHKEKILSLRPDCFELINYTSHPEIKTSKK